MNDWPRRLLDWFAANAREMPWRSHPTPYRVWISEIMLQQTQVSTVIPYFDRFMDVFPTVRTLADAELDRVLKLWEGLGYYSRARNLHKAARRIVDDFDCKIPDDSEAIRSLPGIGDYTAAAILSIAFGRPYPVVDGNVLRVYARFTGCHDDVSKASTRTTFFNDLTPAIERSGDPSAFNQGMMELGALICSPKSPKCNACPVAVHCTAFADELTEVLPVKAKRAPVPEYDIVVAVIWRDGKFFIQKRGVDKMLGGLWEFPGGKRERGESRLRATCREVSEETGWSVVGGTKLGTVKHAYSHFKINMTAFQFELGEDQPESPPEPVEGRWISWDNRHEYAFPKANLKLFELMEEKRP